MSDLKKTLTELVKYLDCVHTSGLPKAKLGASTTVTVIRYCRTGQEMGDTRFSADARSVVACKYLGVSGGRIEGRLKQAVIAARRNKRRGGSNAKWAREFFGNISRLGGIALEEKDAPAIAVTQTVPEEVVAPAQAAVAPSEVIDESQWGGAAATCAGSWDDEDAGHTFPSGPVVGDWEAEAEW